MRSISKILSSVFISFVVLFVLGATPALAKVIANQTGDVAVAKTEVVNDDLFIGAKTAEIEGTVNGDVYIGADTVTVSGIVNGNLHVGTGTLNLDGKVTGNVYAGAGSVVSSGAQIGGSLLVGSGNVSLDKDTTIGGSLLAGSGNITVSSPVKRNVFIGAGTLLLDSSVGGEARLGGGNVSLGPNAKVAKDLYYAINQNQKDITMADTATIAGMTHKTEYNMTVQKDVQTVRNQIPGILRGLGVFSTVVSFLGALVVGFVYLKFFKSHFTGTAELAAKSFWKSLGVGLLVTVLMVPVLILLAITVVGAPLAGVTFMLLMIFFYLNKLIVGLCFGNWLSKKFSWKASTFGAFALGLLGLYILKMIPVVSIFTNLAILWVGLGALSLNLLSKSK